MDILLEQAHAHLRLLQPWQRSRWYKVPFYQAASATLESVYYLSSRVPVGIQVDSPYAGCA